MAMQDEYKAEAVKEMEKINSDRALRYEYISREIARMDAISDAKDKEKLKTEQEKLRIGQEELRRRTEDMACREDDMNKREEDINKREESINKREEGINKREEELRQIQIKFQLATHMMAAGEAELFLKLEHDPELFRQKLREYRLEI